MNGFFLKSIKYLLSTFKNNWKTMNLIPVMFLIQIKYLISILKWLKLTDNKQGLSFKIFFIKSNKLKKLLKKNLKSKINLNNADILAKNAKQY